MLDNDSCRPLFGNRHRYVTSGKEGERAKERESRERPRAREGDVGGERRLLELVREFSSWARVCAWFPCLCLASVSVSVSASASASVFSAVSLFVEMSVSLFIEVAVSLFVEVSASVFVELPVHSDENV